MKVRTNINETQLYCCHCKEKIEIDERYIFIQEEVYYGIVDKVYHIDCCPCEEDEEPYIAGSELGEDDISYPEDVI